MNYPEYTPETWRPYAEQALAELAAERQQRQQQCDVLVRQHIAASRRRTAARAVLTPNPAYSQGEVK